jgi:hypothetical protein
MSNFPISGLSSNGNRVIEKSKIDNELFFDNLDALGPNWGEAFVEPMSCAFTDGAERYKLLHSYVGVGVLTNLFTSVSGVASIGTDFFLCGSSSVRPSKYNIATNSWSEGSMAYNDYGSLGICTGAFGYGGNAYFYTNNPDMGTSVNFFEIKKYNPVANTWITLTSLSSGNLGTVVYGFMGIANGYAYFMQMIKSDNVSYVPAGFPTVYRYQFSGDAWSSAAVTPPLVKTGGYASSSQGHDFFLRGNNAMSCQLSDTEFLIHVKGFTGGTDPVLSHNTEEVYKYDATANTFTFVCRFKRMGKSDPFEAGMAADGPVQGTFRKLLGDSRIFYNNGIIYMWYPWLRGLKAYSIAESKYYFIPIESSALWLPMVCYEGGKIYMFMGYSAILLAYNMVNNNGIIIDLAAISAFLNKEKTLAVNVKSFD